MKEKIKLAISKLRLIGLAALGGILWRMGGSDKYPKAVRRLGVSILLTAIAFWKTSMSLWSLITFPVALAVFTLGYGIPDSTDEGSMIARFWYKVLKMNYLDSTVSIIEYGKWKQWERLEFITRATVGFGYSLSYIPFGLLLGSTWLIPIMLWTTLAIPIICSLNLNVVKEESLIGTIIVAGMLLVSLSG